MAQGARGRPWEKFMRGRGGGMGRGRGSGSNFRGGGRGGTGGDRSQHSDSPGGDAMRPPPHLKGRQIGLWYRDHGVQKKRRTLPKIQLSPGKQAKICGLIQRLEEGSSGAETDAKDSEFLRRYRQNLFENIVAGSRSETDSEQVSTVLEKHPPLDFSMIKELEMKQQSRKYQSMMEFREKLPAFQHKDAFLKLLETNQVIVISGETGCGKTTQCCQLILDDMIRKGDGSLCNIVCTQPRRISAISVAERVAEERDEIVGRKSVGYSIRLESRLPANDRGSILFCTTGVIFQYLKDDPQLNRFSHIVVDEIHERDVLSDFLMAILKDVMLIRPDLKVILMSATINADHFSKYFDNCPHFNIPGFTFPVQDYYLEDVLEKTSFTLEDQQPRGGSRPQSSQSQRGRGGYRGGKRYDQPNDEESEFARMLEVHIRKLEREHTYPRSVINELSKPKSEDFNLDLIEALLRYIVSTDKENGAILIFVPGWDQISKLNTQLQGSGRFPNSKYLIIPLHSMMPTVNQREVFNRPPRGCRKIIISTNIAETSITIDDIVFVIDAGRIKMTNYDLNRNLETLDTEWVSLANATQRRGRAGRVQEGVCYHLFSKARLLVLERFKKPEVLRKRLEDVVLQIKVLRLGSAAQFLRRLLDPPSPKAVDLAIKRLLQLNALDDDENLTPLGFHLAHLPMDPQTGKMILMSAIFGCVDPILTVASSLSFKDAFYIPLGQEKNVDRMRKELSKGTRSDHMVSVYAMEGYERACSEERERDYCYRHFLSGNTLNLLRNMRGQFAQYLAEMKFASSHNPKESSSNINSDNTGILTAIICAGLYPNVARVFVNPRRDGSFSYPIIRTPEDGKVDLHPKSVNAGGNQYESPYLVYFEKMKSKSLFLYDTTMVSPFPLIFFGGQLNYRREKDLGIVTVDHSVEFLIEKPIFEIILALRRHLDKLLEAKINNPGPTCWNELSREGALLRAIVELITAEYREILGESPMGDSESDDD